MFDMFIELNKFFNARQQTSSTSNLRGFVAHICGCIRKFDVDLNHPFCLIHRSLLLRVVRRRFFRRLLRQQQQQVFVLQ